MTGMRGAGIYGKLPSHGDFLRRRVSDAFVAAWDAWLQQGLATSRETLGDRWLDVYLTSPVWRFSCAAEACGPVPVVGLLVPSVDSVGRYFPLTVAIEWPDAAGPLAAVTDAAPLLDAAERIVLETLETERIDFEGFDDRVRALVDDVIPPEAGRITLDTTASDILAGASDAAWRLPVGSASALSGLLQQIVSRHMSVAYEPLVLWWTDGSSQVEPSFLVGTGLPPPHRFTALLDGSWAASDWHSISASPGTSRPTATREARRVPAIGFLSAGASDVGRVRSVNQDAFIERPEVGIWAVADGLGGHRRGEVASRMVCDALADQIPEASFEETVEGAKRRIQAVNGYLYGPGGSAASEIDSGSTVAALLARGDRFAVVWAGDSRVYRFRNGHLEQITQDHTAEESGIGGHQTSLITRAVGGQAELVLDTVCGRLEPGERFLLCSDGLTRVVSASRIGDWMAHRDVRTAADGLIKIALQAGASDNVTVVIVESFA